IEDAIFMIEKKLRSRLDLDLLAKEVGVSKYHLHHLFKSLTGKSLMSYIRGRRLTHSLHELLYSNLRIIDIAHEYQFSHEQSYIHAFKQTFSITPAQYRKTPHKLPVQPKIDLSRLRSIEQGLIMCPRICIRPQFFIQGLQDEIVHEANLTDQTANKLVMQLKDQYLPLIKNIKDTAAYIGLVLYTDHWEYSNYYIPSFEITGPSPVEPPFVQYKIPPYEYAVFRYIGFHSPFEITYATLKGLYDYIDDWKGSMSYTQDATFHFEQLNLKNCSDTYCEMDIYIPVEAKSQNTGVQLNPAAE
ncbi:MAG: helix-turn-helix domain-containing protein, partial [Oscillospiraceae bacterium]|nr:helix-turn-helix domain-containing protein [Oscillospiraceae bacterium]